MTISLTLSQVSKMDRETRELMKLYSSAKIKVGLELAKRLKQFRDEKLYSKLDEDSYPTFPEYLKSLNISYSTATEVIALYEAFVIEGGLSIEYLATIPYHNLTIIKPKYFKKEGIEYKLLTTKTELKKGVAEAGSDITQEDLMQKRREEEIGNHTHEWQEYKFRKCKYCKLKEFFK